MNNIKPSWNLISKIKNNAASSTLSENFGRRSGYFGDYDDETRGYSAILIYIQLGLSEYKELIHEVVRLILSVQSDFGKYYPIVTAAFGKGNDFIHEGKYFKMGSYLDKQSDFKISEHIQKLSGKSKSDIPAILPDFFPKTDNRSLYTGKISFERNDLMVIIGKKDEVFFAEHLQDKMTSSVKKRILFVEIDGESVNWNYQNFEMKYYFKEKDMRKENFKLLTFHGKLNPDISSKESNFRNALYLIGSLELHYSKNKVICIRIIGYEIPLKDIQKRDTCLDLLGFDSDFNPYIIELKIDESTESIDKIINQINNYAMLFDEIKEDISSEIAKKLFWNDFRFKGETKKILLATRKFYKKHTVLTDKSIIYCSIGNIQEIFDEKGNCLLYNKLSSTDSIYLKIEK